MIHNNSNLLCAIDVETTGLDPRRHDIIEIAILPIGFDYRPDKNYKFFHAVLRPDSLEDIDPDAAKTVRLWDDSLETEDFNLKKERLKTILETGIDPSRAADLLVDWFEKLKLPPKKRLIPLACNWIFDHSFIKAWLGQATMDLVFDPRYRDLMSTACFINDYADAHVTMSAPFAKVSLPVICARLNVTRRLGHNALDDVVATAECYRKMVYGGYYMEKYDPAASYVS